MPTNTRALITVRFIESGTVNGLEVTRFCDLPFANDYWYLIKGRTENILESAARAGETGNFRVVGFDELAGLDSSGDFHGSGSTVAIQSMMSCQLDLVNRLRNAANLPAYGSPFFRCDSDFLGRENQLLKSAEECLTGYGKPNTV